MRPIRLRMRGFGAFRDETTIDFSDLDLFAIVGDTGAGKSTIIDAITFALYGSVVRYDDISLVAPALNTQSNEATLVLDFTVDDVDYRVTRVVRRTAKGANTAEARLERGDEVLSASASDLKGAVAAVVGLDFNRFVNVIVLPQGRFSTLLHAKSSDRQKLLRELLDLKVFERMRADAHQRERRAVEQKAAIESTLASLELDPESLAHAERALEHARVVDVAIEEAVDHWRRAQERAEQADMAAEELGVLALAFSELTVPPAVVDYDANVQNAQNELLVAEESERTAQSDRDEQAQLVAVLPTVEHLDHQLDRWQRHQAVIARIEALAERIEELTATRDEAIATQRQLRHERDEATATVENAAAAVDDARRQLADLPSETQLDRWRQLRSRYAKAEAQLQASIEELDHAAAVVETERAAHDRQEREAHRLREQRAVAETADRVAAITAELSLGDECPVCGQVVESFAPHAGDNAAQLAELIADLADADDQLERNAKALAAAQVQHKLAEKDAEAARREREQAETALADVPDRQEIEAVQASVDRVALVVAEAEAAHREARAKELEQQRSERLETANAAFTAAETALASAQAELASQRQALTELKDALSDVAELEVLQQQRDEVVAASAELARRQDAVTSAEGATAHASQQLATLEGTERDLRHEFHRTRDRFAGLLGAPAVTGESLVADWDALAQWGAEKATQALGLHHDALTTAVDAQRATDEAANAARRLAAESLGSTEANQLADIDGIARRAADLRSDAEARLAYLREQFERVAEKRKEVEALDADAEVFGVLHKLLRSDGFERWLLNDIMVRLADHASERLFTLSQGQYSLETTGENFEVVDHRNGDEVRPAKTLSGGETFLASLSLALALAEVISESSVTSSPPIEALFLDEGFGTLDPEHLDIVAGVLEELGSSGRMVGVVTHIRELADRMPVRLEVKRAERSAVITRTEG